MRVYIAQLQATDEALLTIGSMAHPQASDIAIHPYHATLLATTAPFTPEMAEELEKHMVEVFVKYQVTSKHLDGSTWTFFTYSDQLALDMIEYINGPSSEYTVTEEDGGSDVPQVD